jgi:hypothetical protein
LSRLTAAFVTPSVFCNACWILVSQALQYMPVTLNVVVVSAASATLANSSVAAAIEITITKRDFIVSSSFEFETGSINKSQNRPKQVRREKSDEINASRNPQDHPAHAARGAAGVRLIDRAALSCCLQLGPNAKHVNKIGGNQQARNGEGPILVS